MTNSGDDPAPRPPLARLERDGIVRSAVGANAVVGKDFSEDLGAGDGVLGSAKVGALAAKQMATDKAGAVKSGEVLGSPKVGALAAKQMSADKAGAVKSAADLGSAKVGAPLATKQRDGEKPAVTKGGDWEDPEVEAGALAPNQRAAGKTYVIKGAADLVVAKAGVLAANQRGADKPGVIKGGEDPEVEAGALAANQCAADKTYGIKGAADSEVKASVLAPNQRAADHVVYKTGGVAGNSGYKAAGAREKNKRRPDVVNDAGSPKRRKTATFDSGHGMRMLPTSDSEHETLKATGSVTQAFDQSRREMKLTAIYISNQDEDSRRFEQSILLDEHVAEAISRCCVFLKLKGGDADAIEFSDLHGHNTPEELTKNLEKAWATLHLQINVESGYEKEQMLLNLHQPGHDCEIKDENEALGLKIIEDDPLNGKLEDLGKSQSGSRTLYMGNIPFAAEHNEIKYFFRELSACSTITDVRIAMHPEGKSKGFAHIEFNTSEAAQEALKLNGKELFGRSVRLDMASDYSVHAKKGVGRIAVRGFPKAIPEEEVRSIMQSQFSKCGAIKQIYIPLHNKLTNGVAFIDFGDHSSYSQALKLNGLKVAGFQLFVLPMRGSIPSTPSRSAELGKEFGD